MEATALVGVEGLDLAIGALQLALAVVLVVNLRRFGRAFPWLAALLVFFALRGSQRVYGALAETDERLFGFAGDLLLIAALVLLVLGLDSTMRGLRLAGASASAQAREYERALRDYRRLARHRIANPLAVIRGGVATLRELDLDAEQRAAVVASIEEAALELERLALDPEPKRPEERGLRPRPRLDSPPA